jgi:hypothetical protein
VCTFISAVLPADADVEIVATTLRAHGRACTPYAHPTLCLEAREQLCSTTPGHCDCGTLLASSRGETDVDRDAQWRDRMRRKGWSPAKIARAEKQRMEAGERPVSPKASDSVTSLSEWRALIEAVLQSRATASFGLFIEASGRGRDHDAPLTPTRHQVHLASLDEAMLAGMQEFVIYEFRR